MFPGKKSLWWQRCLPTNPFIGASVYPLNRYFVGGSLEPIHGFFVTLGPVFGSQTSLPEDYPYKLGQQVTTATAPAIPDSSRFRVGGFVMVGFDTSLFKEIFKLLLSSPGVIKTIGTPAGSQ
jgi:hypothetical protein